MKIQIIATFVGLIVITATAQAADVSHKQLLQCQTIKQDNKRLACYDALSEAVKDDPEQHQNMQPKPNKFPVLWADLDEANLAISLSRQENCRTLLLDFDMRRPNMHKILGINDPGSLGDMLRGVTAPGDHLLRMGRNPVNAGRNIAFGLNSRPEAYAAELLQDPRAEECLRRIEDDFAPDVVLIDLPPALSYDDVIAARPLFDGVLLVIGGGMTTEKEIAEVERRLGDSTPILGMILNKAEGTELDRYSY